MALDFVDTNSDNATASSVVVPQDEGTFTFWFNPDYDYSTEVGNHYLFDCATVRYTANFNGSEDDIYLNADGRYKLSEGINLLSGTWYHLAFAYKKGTDLLQIYKNGVAQTMGSAGGAWGGNSPPGTFYIGKRYAAPFSYEDAQFADFAIYNVALVAADLLQLAKKYTPLQVKPTNLVEYWPMIRDGKGRFGNDLTLNGPDVVAHPPIIMPAPVFYSFPTVVGTTAPPTTAAPTTLAPTTLAPTTLAPTTPVPTTPVPTTPVPTTPVPTTPSPTTIAPTTLAPTTIAPTTLAPTTAVPTTVAPTTLAPTTPAPTTLAPTTPIPTTPVPTTVAPTTLAPTTPAPTTPVPTTPSPTTPAPTTVGPTTTPPTTIAPTTILVTTLPSTTVIPTTVIPTTAPPVVGLRRGIKNLGLSMRSWWRM